MCNIFGRAQIVFKYSYVSYHIFTHAQSFLCILYTLFFPIYFNFLALLIFCIVSVLYCAMPAEVWVWSLASYTFLSGFICICFLFNWYVLRWMIPQWSLRLKRLIFVALCNDLTDYFIVCFEHQCTMRAV